MRIHTQFFSSLALLAFSSSTAFGDCTEPCAGYEIAAELQHDWIFSADPSSLQSHVLQPTVISEYFLAPVDFLKLIATIVTEPVVDPLPGDTAVFEGVGTYVGELYAELDAGPATVRAGKFDTVLSLASEVASGIHDAELASQLDADERIGAEVVFGFEGFGLNHGLAATAYTTDRSILSEGLFTHRGRASLSDGGAGNSSGVSSVSVTLSGCQDAAPEECHEDGSFGYRFGFRDQNAGQPTQEQIDDGISASDEQAFLAGTIKNFELDEMKLRLLAEAAYLRNFEAGPDDALILTGSAALDIDQMRYIAALSHQRNLIAGESDTRSYLADVEAIYISSDDRPFAGARWTLGTAYTYARNDDAETSHTLSLRATLGFVGSVEFGRSGK